MRATPALVQIVAGAFVYVLAVAAGRTSVEDLDVFMLTCAAVGVVLLLAIAAVGERQREWVGKQIALDVFNAVVHVVVGMFVLRFATTPGKPGAAEWTYGVPAWFWWLLFALNVLMAAAWAISVAVDCAGGKHGG